MDYYADPRPEMLPFYPAALGRVLEVGCAEGRHGELLLRNGMATSVTGVERHQRSAEAARRSLSDVYEGAIESFLADYEGEPFETILALDVLEHLEDPWTVTNALVSLLRPRGTLVVSIPNVRFLGVAAPLLFAGRFEYAASGVLDRTHLRFFTRSTIRTLLTHDQLEEPQIHRLTRSGGRLVFKPVKAIIGDLGNRQFVGVVRKR